MPGAPKAKTTFNEEDAEAFLRLLDPAESVER
jgi:hypothetical protein